MEHFRRSLAAPAPRVGALSTVYAPTKRSGHRTVVDVRAGRSPMVLSQWRARALAQCGVRTRVGVRRGYIPHSWVVSHSYALRNCTNLKDVYGNAPLPPSAMVSTPGTPAVPSSRPWGVARSVPGSRLLHAGPTAQNLKGAHSSFCRSKGRLMEEMTWSSRQQVRPRSSARLPAPSSHHLNRLQRTMT